MDWENIFYKAATFTVSFILTAAVIGIVAIGIAVIMGYLV